MVQGHLEWQDHAFHDPVKNRVYVWGKDASAPNSWCFSYYDIPADAWSAVWTNQALGTSGHVYGNNTMDPATGDQYAWWIWPDTPGGHAPARKFTSSTGVMSNTSIDTVFNSGSFDSSPDFGSVWFPNAFGPGDGALCIFTELRCIFWRKSTDTWSAVMLPGGSIDAFQNGACEYLASQNAAFFYSATRCMKIAPGPVVTTVSSNHPNIKFTTSSVNATPGKLHLHPSDDNRLMMLLNSKGGATASVYSSTNGTIWTPESYTHPFTDAADQGYTLARVRPFAGAPNGAFWAISKTQSRVWKPNN